MRERELNLKGVPKILGGGGGGGAMNPNDVMVHSVHWVSTSSKTPPPP